MGCQQSTMKRERAMAKARQLRDAKVDRLTKRCEAGNEGACLTLRNLLLSESYREQIRYRPELHHQVLDPPATPHPYDRELFQNP